MKTAEVKPMTGDKVEKRVLRKIRKLMPVTFEELAKRLKMPHDDLSTNLAKLRQAKRVEEDAGEFRWLPIPPKFEAGQIVTTNVTASVVKARYLKEDGQTRSKYVHVLPGAEWSVIEVYLSDGLRRPSYLLRCQGHECVKREGVIRLLRKA